MIDALALGRDAIPARANWTNRTSTKAGTKRPIKRKESEYIHMSIYVCSLLPIASRI